MARDEDFDEEEVNYKKICKRIIRGLKKIKKRLVLFDNFNLSGYQKEDLVGIKEKLENLAYSEYNNRSFTKLMGIICQVEDFLEEMTFVLGDLARKVNNPSKYYKKEIYSLLGVEKATPKLKKLLSSSNLTLSRMSKIIQELIKRYFVYYKEAV